MNSYIHFSVLYLTLSVGKAGGGGGYDGSNSKESLRTFEITKIGNAYYCECNRQFKNKNLLQYHLRHDCGRCHKCKYCMLFYRSIDSLNRHMRVRH